jgi:hypothetical protein
MAHHNVSHYPGIIMTASRRFDMVRPGWGVR